MSQTTRTSRGRILPREQGAAPLDVVIAVMAFLAALAIGASLVAHRAAQGWQAGLSGSLTVQILPPQHGAPQPALDKETNRVAQILRSTQGIASVTPVSKEDAMKLVKPWLGSDALVSDLPLPRLVDAQVIPGARVDLAALSSQLKKAAPDSVLDDHSHWLSRLKLLADTVMWAAYIILTLIAIATASIVAFATRAGLEAHHNIVALLHQMGAHSSFIAHAFERHYFVSTLAASAIGAALAGLLFLLTGWLEFAGIEPVPFLPPLALHLAELAWLAAVPLGAGAIAWATARLSVLAALRKIY